MLHDLKAEQNTHQIHSGTKSDSITKVKPDIFYSYEEYLRLQGLPDPITYSYEALNGACGRISFQQVDDLLVSGHFAPFGSFAFSENIDRKDARRFIHQITNIERSLKIRHYPSIYGLEWLTTELLASKELSITKDLNHHIDLKSLTIDDLHPMQKRRIKKCQKLGFTVRKVTDHSQFSEIYGFIRGCRIEQGITINITEEKFIQSLKVSDHYNLFVVWNNDEIMCCSLLVKVNDDIIYNYLPASSAKSKQYSPMTFLIDYLVKYYRKAGFKYFDWGQTSINGVEQKSLAQFKERMGAVRSDKYTFVK